jgi:hypothetical protein
VPTESVQPGAATTGRPVSHESSPTRSANYTGRIGPGAGILGVVLLYTGLVVHGYPGGSTAELVKWATTTDQTRFHLGIYIEAAGLLLLLVFFAWMAGWLRRGDAAAALVMLAFGAALLWVGIGVTVNGMWTAVLVAGKRGTDPQNLAGLRDVAQESYNASNLFAVVLILAFAVGLLRTHILPAWLGWAAVVIGVAMVIPVVRDIAQLFLTVWVVVVAAVALFRPPVAGA